jgi:4-diphosphocytidyl-2-C-methyl-D-erythritol kinase
MGEGVFVEAPCKLNLHLEVLGKRSDGFHDLVSLFQQVSLSDEITIETLKDYSGIRIDDDSGIPAELNIAGKAAEAFFDSVGFRSGVRISIKKRVPVGAGLGGGSSDAAAVLRGLDALFGLDLGSSRLSEIGSRIGSDVPFFCTAACALVTGRGEIVKPVVPRADFVCLLVDPGFPISTADAYRELDRYRDTGESAKDDLPSLSADGIVSMYSGDVSEWRFGNSFLPALEGRYPELRRIIGTLGSSGAGFAGMTGSGSTLFGIFSSKKEADAAAERLGCSCREKFFAIPLACWRSAVVK